MKNHPNVIALATERKVDATRVAVARFMKVLKDKKAQNGERVYYTISSVKKNGDVTVLSHSE